MSLLTMVSLLLMVTSWDVAKVVWAAQGAKEPVPDLPEPIVSVREVCVWRAPGLGETAEVVIFLATNPRPHLRGTGC